MKFNGWFVAGVVYLGILSGLFIGRLGSTPSCEITWEWKHIIGSILLLVIAFLFGYLGGRDK